jgi:regulatory protein
LRSRPTPPERDPAALLQKALEVGYAYLSRRERTVAEVRAQLERKGIGNELAGEAIRSLQAQGVLDDARFARLFVTDKRELEQWGTERIRRGLLTRGIDRELAEEALATAPVPSPLSAGMTAEDPPQTELERALALLRSRYPEPPAERRERERALGFLLRKGYESELALDALHAHARRD